MFQIKIPTAIQSGKGTTDKGISLFGEKKTKKTGSGTLKQTAIKP